MEKNRGLAFIVGIGSLVLLSRLFVLGDLADIIKLLISYVTGTDINSLYSVAAEIKSPLQLFAEVIGEAIIAFGGAIILATQGVWSVVYIVYVWLGELAETLLKYLKSLQGKAEVDTLLAAVPPTAAPTPPEADFNRMILLILQQQGEQLAAIRGTPVKTPDDVPAP